MTNNDRSHDSQELRRTICSPRFWVTLVIVLAINWFLAPQLFSQPQDRVIVPYAFFKQQAAAGNVTEITSRDEDLQGTFKQMLSDPTAAAQTLTAQPAGVQAPQTYAQFATTKPAFDDPELLTLLEQNVDSVCILCKNPLEMSCFA